jgi:anthranilate/para-aminobenzoate synthase component I
MSAMEKKTPPKIKLVEKNKINFDWYKNAFEKGFNHLQKGNCYQFNLTAPFVYQLQQSTNEKWKNSFFQSTVGKSAFAHSTFLGDGGPILYSNSPECLFQVKQGPNDCVYIQSMPIKGTVKIEKNQLHKLWQKMQSDEKNRAELSMITDLMANDLSRIQFPNAKVISTSVPLLVPGLMHQYSIVESIVDSNVSLKHVIQAMFPGGSITGAPKIKAMEILHQLEMAPRGFYCGSTLLAGRGMLAACINIRTAWINDGQQSMQVGAGGGITIRSNIQEEWQEMLAKRDSFLNFLQKTGCFEII